MSTMHPTKKNQSAKISADDQGGKQVRLTPDDRQEVGLIAAILVVLALGVLGYWIFEEGDNRATGTISTTAANSSDDWEKEKVKAKNQGSMDNESSSSFAVPILVDSGTSPSQAQAGMPTPRDMNVYFGFNQHRLTDEAKALVQEEFERRSTGNWTVSVEGHTDEFGPEPYNQALGLRRAQSVKEFLIGLGLTEESVRIKSMGETSPVCLEKAEDCYHKNRRAYMQWSEGKIVAQGSQSQSETPRQEGDGPIQLATAPTGESDKDAAESNSLKTEETQ